MLVRHRTANEAAPLFPPLRIDHGCVVVERELVPDEGFHTLLCGLRQIAPLVLEHLGIWRNAGNIGDFGHLVLGDEMIRHQARQIGQAEVNAGESI